MTKLIEVRLDETELSQAILDYLHKTEKADPKASYNLAMAFTKVGSTVQTVVTLETVDRKTH